MINVKHRAVLYGQFNPFKAPAHRIDTGRTELTLGRGERVEQAALAFPVWLSVRQTAQTRL